MAAKRRNLRLQNNVPAWRQRYAGGDDGERTLAYKLSKPQVLKWRGQLENDMRQL